MRRFPRARTEPCDHPLLVPITSSHDQVAHTGQVNQAIDLIISGDIVGDVHDAEARKLVECG